MRLAPLRSHSPWTQQKQTNLYHICHSTAVPKAALRGPSTSSTDSPASQHQTLFFSAALSLPLPYTGNNDNAKENKLHRTKQDRSTNHRQNSFPPPLRSQPHLPDATVERLTTRTIASHHPMPHMITLHITLPCPSWKNSRAIETGTSNRKRPKHPEVPVSRIRLSSMPLPVFRLSSPSQSSRLRHHVERAFARQRQISELGNRQIHARIQTVNDPTNRGLPYLLPGSGQTGLTKKH